PTALTTTSSFDVTVEDGNEDSSTPVAQTFYLNRMNRAPTGEVTIGGTATEDQVLTADTSTLNDADGLGPFAYQWQRNHVNIAGATGSTYTLGDADVGKEINVVVSYTDGGGTNESYITGPTPPVDNVNDAPTGTPTVSGPAVQNATLTANTSGIAD